MEWKDKVSPNSLNEDVFKVVFLQDIKDLEASGITHKDFKKVRELISKSRKNVASTINKQLLETYWKALHVPTCRLFLTAKFNARVTQSIYYL